MYPSYTLSLVKLHRAAVWQHTNAIPATYNCLLTTRVFTIIRSSRVRALHCCVLIMCRYLLGLVDTTDLSTASLGQKLAHGFRVRLFPLNLRRWSRYPARHQTLPTHPVPRKYWHKITLICSRTIGIKVPMCLYLDDAGERASTCVMGFV